MGGRRPGSLELLDIEAEDLRGLALDVPLEVNVCGSWVVVSEVDVVNVVELARGLPLQVGPTLPVRSAGPSVALVATAIGVDHLACKSGGAADHARVPHLGNVQRVAGDATVQPRFVPIGYRATVENLILVMPLPRQVGILCEGLSPPWGAAHRPDRVAPPVLVHDVLPLHLLLAGHRVGIVVDLVRCLAACTTDALRAPHTGVQQVLICVPRILLLELVSKDVAP